MKIGGLKILQPTFPHWRLLADFCVNKVQMLDKMFNTLRMSNSVDMNNY